jgi:hypothetical protein
MSSLNTDTSHKADDSSFYCCFPVQSLCPLPSYSKITKVFTECLCCFSTSKRLHSDKKTTDLNQSSSPIDDTTSPLFTSSTLRQRKTSEENLKESLQKEPSPSLIKKKLQPSTINNEEDWTLL